MEFSAKDIAKLVSGEIEGDETVLINDFSKIDQGKSGTLSFLANPKYEEFIYNNEIEFQNEIRLKSINKLEKAIFDFGVLPTVEINIAKKPFYKYHIIAGAFRLESNANNLFDLLLSKGYNPTKLPLNDKGLTPISFDNFSNRKDAVIALRKFQKSENKDAWIFEKQ